VTTRISLVVAMTRNRVIGRNGGMPWHLPDELRHFKAVTLDHPIVMGRNTHESIGRALPGRPNIVVTRNPDYTAEGCRVAHSLDEALLDCAEWDEVMIIGGGQLYREALPHADRIHLTLIETELEGDTFFPELEPAEWNETELARHPADDRHDYAYRCLRLDRIRDRG